ncbi:MAG: serine protease Do [Gammaproteobacteria bacterium]
MIISTLRKFGHRTLRFLHVIFAIALSFALTNSYAHDTNAIAKTIAKVKPSVVGIGTFSAVRRPPNNLMGTGFVVGDGTLIATNFHVIPDLSKLAPKEQLVVYVGSGRTPDIRPAKVIANDEKHDLAILKISGAKIPPLTLDSGGKVAEGTAIGFTGFPIGAVLGLYPVTHTGIISAVTPIAIPARTARELTAQQIDALKDPYFVYQLDAVAYPGNSGSPLFRMENGHVVGIINKVFVKQKKETLLSDPSAITYAVPLKYLKELLSDL